MKNKLITTYYTAKNAFAMRMAGIRSDRENGDHLLEVLGVIIIAVVILIFFRRQLIDLFQTAMSSTSDKVNGLFEDVGTDPAPTNTTNP